jgi:ribulose kinase
MPFKVLKRSETTVLGAALFAMPAAGMFTSTEEAARSIDNPVNTYLPGNDKETYEQLFSVFKTQWLSKREP